MTNFGAKILNNATGSLAAQQAVIASIGNNIANVNTPGYARRVVDLQTRVSHASPGTLNIGNGVNIGDIQRVADSFIENILRDATSNKGQSEVELEFMKRIEGLFSVSEDTPTIGSTLSAFFNSLNDLSLNASSIELRKNVLERGEDLVTSIKTTFNSLAGLQTEADGRLTTEIDNVNSLTSQIAELNGLVTQRESTGTTASDERDRRDILMTKLSEKLSYNTVENSDGSVTLSLSNGFSLVNGTTSRALSLTVNPSFAVAGMPPSLAGGILQHIVFDYSGGAGTAEVDLTQVMKNGTGAVAGLLNIRGYNDPANGSTGLAFQADGILPEMASRVEAITRMLLVKFNQTYIGGDDDPATAGVQPKAADLDGVRPTDDFAFFTWTGVADDGDVDPELAELTAGYSGTASLSSKLALNITDPRNIAVALDSDPANAAVSFETGNGDGARALADLQNDNTLDFSAGTFAGAFTLNNSTFAEVFAESVTHVGNATARANLDNNVAQSNLLTIQSRRDEVSGVSLDEEFSNLIRFQKAYQASARMISVADKLLDQIIQLI
jgi:flagellar hook-associated protein 1 FlgK